MESKYANYYGLMFDCPIGEAVSNCCFKKIRKFPVKEKLTFYTVMTEHEKHALIGKHQQCLSVREKKTLFHESQ